jgi:AcrR family transcriptional regulator
MAYTKRQAMQRDRLFGAALTVGLEDGFGRVTLEKVAERAGVSKGGLLYHFNTKEDFVRDLLDRYGGSAPGENGQRLAKGEVDPFIVAVLIAAADNPDLLVPIAEKLGLRESSSASLGMERWKVVAHILLSRKVAA